MILPLQKFSSSTKLFRVTYFVIKFVNRLQRLEVDSEKLAAIFLMKTMQQQSYSLEFFLDPSDRTISRLVWDTDLFIDRKDLIWSGGRISRSLHFNIEIKHPSCWLNVA